MPADMNVADDALVHMLGYTMACSSSTMLCVNISSCAGASFRWGHDRKEAHPDETIFATAYEDPKCASPADFSKF